MQANGSSRPRINAECAYLFYPSFGIVDLQRLTVFFKFASTSVSCSALSPSKYMAGEIVNKRVRGKHAPAGNICLASGFEFRRYRLVPRRHRPTPGLPRVAESTPVPSCLVVPDGLLGVPKRVRFDTTRKESGERGRLACVVECGARGFERHIRHAWASAPPRAYPPR